MNISATTDLVEVSMDDVKAVLDRAKDSLNEEDHQLLNQLVDAYACLSDLINDKTMTIAQLRALLGSSKSEKTKDVLGDAGEQAPVEEEDTDDAGYEKSDDENKRKGHGRNGVKDYPGADRVATPHPSLQSGDPCPMCEQGKVYPLKTPGVIVRISGQSPLQATIYEQEKLRCNLCGVTFTAPAPEGIGEEKYDAKAASMIALLKYGSGLPFNRLGGLQRSLGVPLPPSTQWDVISTLAERVDPAYQELIRQAAQGEVLHNDDTSMTILERMGKRRAKWLAGSDEDPDRTGTFTSGVVSTAEGRRIVLYFTGGKHAGENLAEILSQRVTELGAPIQMCDALSRNTSPAFDSIVANCLAHGRRRFVNVVDNFPSECRHVLETLGAVYKNDAAAKKQQMTPEQRLEFHQTESAPLMEQLHTWMTQQLDERRVEPNSGLGEAIGYMLRHWEKLTAFLRVPGAPLDNNACERALKKAILHRKNSLFYKTDQGARVGDLLMSLIATCELCDVNTFQYLTALQEHREDVADDPAAWMPWNYRNAL